MQMMQVKKKKKKKHNPIFFFPCLGRKGLCSRSRNLFRNLFLLFVLLVLVLLDFGGRSGHKPLVLRLPAGITIRLKEQQAAVRLTPPLPTSAAAGGAGGHEEEQDEDKEDELAGAGAGAGAGDDGWSAFEQEVDPGVELRPLNTLMDADQDDPKLFECCPTTLRDMDAVCTCAPVLTKMEEVTLNLTTAMVIRWLDDEVDLQPMKMVSEFYSDWKQNLEANPEATIGQKQVFCTETLIEQADASIKKTMDRREKKLQMGVSEANLPWLLQLENIARASKLEIHRAEETSQACLVYIDVIQEENDLRKQVEAKERQERRAKRRAQRREEKRRGRKQDLTKVSSFNCDELKGKSEFRDYYQKICGKDGNGKGRAKVLGTQIIDVN
ncbi:hypothetical protein HOP50_08g53410 [Chloropicon primus]|uniref:Uncharacterized protein n=1 Tax=Chloropicon primus TaxID=1764295 RepID=A0A5B8MQW0_9CHLO|nr:hypothetical protein A3770_08p53110 [Chloropicon primus]UPR02017.1 hypothetical protein HOP50_08g53410 [Chloropicon primus]|eukprot:QDZ22793.1 hypothetical protein A3770_08p53110 [Chloropicon primus]